MTSKRIILAAAVGLASQGALRAAVPLTDFETRQAEGWQNWSNPRSVVADPTGTSSYMLKLDVGQQFFGEWVLPNFANAGVTDANVNANNRFEFDAYFPSALWSNGSAQVRIGFDSASGEVTSRQQTITITPNTKQHVILDYAALGSLPFPSGDWLNINLYLFPGAYTGSPPTYPQSAYIDNVTLTSAAVPEWKVNADGNWFTSSNWTTLPVGPTVTAKLGTFGGTITGARRVTLNDNVTLGGLLFDNPAGYTVDSTNGSGLYLNPNTGTTAVVSAVNGQHSITAPLRLLKDTSFNISNPSTKLTASNLIAQSIAITKQGQGTLEVNRVHDITLDIQTGTLKLTAGGTTASTVTSLSSTGKLDLTDNKLVVLNGTAGTWNGSSYSGIAGLVRSGRNGGNWNGPGIITSMTAATSQTTTLAVALTSEISKTTFGNVSVAPADVLVMYTYTGDANLSGKIDADDYFAIDSNLSKSGAVFGFSKGDFNYDGLINGDDYFLIDSAFASQGPAFSSASVAAVPEPSLLAVLPLAGFAIAGRRRRRITAIRRSTASTSRHR